MNNHGGFRAAVRHVYNEQGARGFWRGNGLNVLKSAPEFAIKWSVYDYAKRRLMAARDDERLDSLDRFAAGAVAGVCSQTFLYPIEARTYTFYPYTDIPNDNSYYDRVMTESGSALFENGWKFHANAFFFAVRG